MRFTKWSAPRYPSSAFPLSSGGPRGPMSVFQSRGFGLVALLVALVADSGAVAHAQPVAAVRIDDGFTWISLADNPCFGSEPRNEGWHPVLSLQAIGAFAPGDAFKMVVRQGSRTLARAVRAGQPVRQHGGGLWR